MKTSDLPISNERYESPISFGLSKQQVKKRISEGLTNIDKTICSKSVSSIIKDNLFTLFNFINFININKKMNLLI